MDRITHFLPPADVNFIIYHGECADGMAAALCGWLFLGKDKVSLYAGKYLSAGETDETLLSMLSATESKVLIVDFSFPRDFLLGPLRQHTKSMVLLDHHETAMNALQDLDFCLFDMNRSGCHLAWDYFFPGVAVPRLLSFIEDRDLWRWKVEGSRDFCAAFYSMPIDVERYAQYLVSSRSGHWVDNEFLLQQTWNEGKVLSRYHDSYCKQRAAKAKVLLTADGWRIGVLNETAFISDVAAIVAQTHGFALLYQLTDENTIKVSLRTDGKRSCTAIAVAFGGGGHPAAAAFVWHGTPAALLEKLTVTSIASNATPQQHAV